LRRRRPTGARTLPLDAWSGSDAGAARVRSIEINEAEVDIEDTTVQAVGQEPMRWTETEA
jgi:hypothetical protein